MTTINELLVAADAFAGKLDAELGAATERLAVGDIKAGMVRVSAAHALVGQQGRDLAAMAKAESAKPPDTPKPLPVDPPAESIVQWAKRVHPETDIGNGYQLHIFALRHAGKTNEAIWAAYLAQPSSSKPPSDKPDPQDEQVESDPADEDTPDSEDMPDDNDTHSDEDQPDDDTPNTTPGDAGELVTVVPWAPDGVRGMQAERMRTPIMAYEFRAKQTGKLTSYEHGGDPRNREQCVSKSPGDFDSPLARATRNGPASSTLTWISVGTDKSGHVRIDPGAYYHNIRAAESGSNGGWDANFAAQQYGVGNSVAA